MKQPFPGVISQIVAQERVKRHLGPRANVFIGGKFSFALSIDLVYKYGLKPDLIIDAAFLEQLLREDGEAKAFTTACNFLGHRARSESEIRTRLARDEWSETVIDKVLDRLRGLQLVNDEQFASQWVENRSRFKPRGARALTQELRQKGVAKEEIAAALPDADEEVQNALAALEKLERKLEAFTGRDREQKAIEWLARRGFGYSTIKTALRHQQENREDD